MGEIFRVIFIIVGVVIIAVISSKRNSLLFCLAIFAGALVSMLIGEETGKLVSLLLGGATGLLANYRFLGILIGMKVGELSAILAVSSPLILIGILIGGIIFSLFKKQ